jgi:hypothetical protein
VLSGRIIDRQRLAVAVLGVLAVVFATFGIAAIADPFENGWPWQASGGFFGAAIGTGWRTSLRARDAGRRYPVIRGLVAGAAILGAGACWLVAISLLNPLASSQPWLSANSVYLLVAAAVISIPVVVLWERTPGTRRAVLVFFLAMYAALAMFVYFLLATTPDRATYEWLGLQAPPWLDYLWLLPVGALGLGVAAVVAHRVPVNRYGRNPV